MGTDDETQHTSTDRSTGRRKRLPAWIRWLGGGARDAVPERATAVSPAERLDVHGTLRALPALLNSSSLPNGIVELVIEDFEASTRQLFDIHDGHITLVEPGQCVPWASISGPAIAWSRALGPERDLAALQLTGDKQLAQRVLAALPPPALEG